MSRMCFFDRLPVELLHTLFNYFLAHEILESFTDISDHINHILLTYSAYRVNLKCISKINFDLICNRIRPEQIVVLIFADDNYTPGLSELFFSRFQIEQFTRLQALKIDTIELDSLKSIFPNLSKLNLLHSFSFNVKKLRKYPNKKYYPSKQMAQIHQTISDTYMHILPKLNHVHVNNDTIFKPFILLPCLIQLKIERCSLTKLEIIFSNASQLQSLDVCLELEKPNLDIISTSPMITRLNLKVINHTVSMNSIERFLLKLLYLKHLQLYLKGFNDLADGFRWEMLTSKLRTFYFELNVEKTSIDKTLQSFRTPFWLEEKHWYVIYEKNCLRSVSDDNSYTRNNLSHKPIYSTIPSDQIRKYLRPKRCNTTSLCISSLDDLKKFIPFEHKLPYVHQLTITKRLFDKTTKITAHQFKQIRKLIIHSANDGDHTYTIKMLAHLFPSTEYLKIVSYEIFSLETMIYTIEKFQYLQNVSFSECSQSAENIIVHNRQAISQMTWRLTDDNFTCRMYRSSPFDEFDHVHWWIGPPPPKSSGPISWLQSLEHVWYRATYISSQSLSKSFPAIALLFSVFFLTEAILRMVPSLPKAKSSFYILESNLWRLDTIFLYAILYCTVLIIIISIGCRWHSLFIKYFAVTFVIIHGISFFF